MAQGCAETGAMQAVAKQCDIVSNGKGKYEIPRVLVLLRQKDNKIPLKIEGRGVDVFNKTLFHNKLQISNADCIFQAFLHF